MNRAVRCIHGNLRRTISLICYTEPESAHNASFRGCRTLKFIVLLTPNTIQKTTKFGLRAFCIANRRQLLVHLLVPKAGTIILPSFHQSLRHADVVAPRIVRGERRDDSRGLFVSDAVLLGKVLA